MHRPLSKTVLHCACRENVPVQYLKILPAREPEYSAQGHGTLELVPRFISGHSYPLKLSSLQPSRDNKIKFNPFTYYENGHQLLRCCILFTNHIWLSLSLVCLKLVRVESRDHFEVVLVLLKLN